MTEEQQKYEQEVSLYRNIGIQNVTLIVTFAAAILALGIIEGSLPSIVAQEFTAKLFWFLATLFIFISILTGLRALFLLTKGYFKQANATIQNFQGNAREDFSSADKYLTFTYTSFTLGLILGFFIFSINYFL